MYIDLHSFGVRQLNKGRLMRLYLHVGSFLKVHVAQNNLRSLFNAEVVHHPNRDVAHALLS